jgi:hypothetical protein
MPAGHSVIWVTGAQINGRDGTDLRRRSAVDKYNEFPNTIKLSFLNGNLMVPNGLSSPNFTQALRDL